MLFLTEDDIRQRGIPEGGELVLCATERLTPSASSYATQLQLRVVEAEGPQCPERQAQTCPEDASKAPSDPSETGLTHLDAATMVPKTHPRIEARGKLDTLVSEIVLVQTLFDPKRKLPALLLECLADLKEWAFQTLAAEVSGSLLPRQTMAGMDPETLRAVSRNPGRYLNAEHLAPDASMGTNLALLNRLRALVRETELATARAALTRGDIQQSLNRLSSAVYVLMLLTHLAESGAPLPTSGIAADGGKD
jgi:ethanolamine utilization cobalamin adenosyltransferase